MNGWSVIRIATSNNNLGDHAIIAAGLTKKEADQMALTFNEAFKNLSSKESGSIFSTETKSLRGSWGVDENRLPTDSQK